MSGTLAALTTLVFAAVVSAVLTSVWIAIAKRHAIEDLPGARRVHGQITPRGGGFGIAIVMAIVLLWLAIDGRVTNPIGFGFAISVIGFSVIGLFDDIRGMSALPKLIWQLIASWVLVATLAPAEAGVMGLLLLSLLIIVCAYTVNIWNFMDGSNGLIVIQTLIISLALAFWPSQSISAQIVALALAGGCIGFAPFNLPTARVFLGDIGSHALGVTVFGLFLLSWYQGTINLAQGLLMGSAMFVDSGLTLLIRAFKGRKVWLAHREHLYQFAIRKGYSHLHVCIGYGVWTTLSVVLAVAVNEMSLVDYQWLALVFNWVLATCVYLTLRRGWLRRQGRGETLS